MTLKVTELYRAMLLAMNVNEAEETGALQVNLDGEVYPFAVTVQRGEESANLPVVLPTPEVMKKEEDGLMLKFHPFAESPFADQSPIFNRMVMVAASRLCESAAALVAEVINASVNYENFESYKNAQMKLVSDMPVIKTAAARDKIVKYASRVLSAHTSIRGEYPILKFNIGRRERDDIDALRWSELTMPVLLEEGADDKRIFGVKAPNQKAYDTVMGAFRVVFGHDSVNGFTGFLNGATSRTAPYFQAFLGTWFEAANHFNKISKALGTLGDKSVRIDVSYDAILTDAEDLAKEIKVQFEGNVGTANGKAEDIAAAQGQTSEKARPISVSVNVKREVEPVVETPKVEETSVETKVQTKAHPMRKTGSVFSAPTSAPLVKKEVPMRVQEAPALEVAPVKKPQASLSVKQPSTAASPKLEVKTRVREVHVHDALNQPLYMVNGAPVMLPENEVPKELFVIASDVHGQVMFDNAGMPELEGITQREVSAILNDPRNRHMTANNGHLPANDPRSRYAPAPQQQHAPHDPRSRYAPAPSHQQPYQAPTQHYAHAAPQQHSSPYGHRPAPHQAHAPAQRPGEVYRQPINGYAAR